MDKLLVMDGARNPAGLPDVIVLPVVTGSLLYSTASRSSLFRSAEPGNDAICGEQCRGQEEEACRGQETEACRSSKKPVGPATKLQLLLGRHDENNFRRVQTWNMISQCLTA